MKFRNNILNVVVLTFIFMVCWYIFDERSLNCTNRDELYYCLVGSHGGYGYFLYIASIYMILFLMIIDYVNTSFSISSLSRIGRISNFNRNCRNNIVIAIVYSCVYVAVEICAVIKYIGIKKLIDNKFFEVMLFYTIAISVIYIFASMCYMLLRMFVKYPFLVIIIIVAFNMFIAYFYKASRLYGATDIIDKKSLGTYVDIAIWCLNELIVLCIIGVLYIFTKSIYEKKDIL